MKRNFDEQQQQQQQQQLSGSDTASNSENTKRMRTTYDSSKELERERAAGITEYVNMNCWPFHAALKQRFSDFIVNEIDVQGNVVHLTDMSIPESMKTAVQNAASDLSAEELARLHDEGLQKLREQLSSLSAVEETLDKIRVLLADGDDGGAGAGASGAGMTSGDLADATVVLPAVNDKEERSALHDMFKTHFPSLVTSTMNAENGDRLIRVQRKKDVKEAFQNMKRKNDSHHDRRKRRGKRGNRGERSGAPDAGSISDAFDVRFNSWPRDRPSYLRFVLYKENFDTGNALSAIARKIRVNKKIFSIAGTKDKRGVTAQYVTAYRMTPEKLVAINHPNSGIHGLRVGNFEYVPEQLTLGTLKGNRFGIVLRDIDASVQDSQLQENIQSLINSGFINYFGLQRFGISSTEPTYRAGIHIVRREWEEAFFSILRSRMDNPQICSAIEGFIKDRDIENAVRNLPGYAITEKVLLNGLAKSGENNYAAAIGALPRILRTMYLHSFQSLVWNNMTSERIRKYGLKPQVGDLVMLSRELVENADFAASEEDAADQIQEDEEEEGSRKQSKFEELEINIKHIETEEEAERFTMEDVVMPIPGATVRFPEHEFGKQQFEEFMAKYGVSLDSISMREYDTQGSYRPVLTRPRDFAWSIKHYSDKDQQLIETDMDNINGIKREGEATGNKRALVLQFNLPSSTYATMLVRELTRSSDSKQE